MIVKSWMIIVGVILILITLVIIQTLRLSHFKVKLESAKQAQEVLKDANKKDTYEEGNKIESNLTEKRIENDDSGLIISIYPGSIIRL